MASGTDGSRCSKNLVLAFLPVGFILKQALSPKGDQGLSAWPGGWWREIYLTPSLQGHSLEGKTERSGCNIIY